MNALEVIRVCAEKKISLSEYAIQRESKQSKLSREEIRSRFRQMLSVMEASAQKALMEPVRSVSGLTGGDAFLYEKHRRTNSLLGGAAAKAIAFALSCTEVNASMGRIVACPTAGSCGIVPAAVLAVEEEHKLPREMIVDSLITAGLWTAPMRMTFWSIAPGCGRCGNFLSAVRWRNAASPKRKYVQWHLNQDFLPPPVHPLPVWQPACPIIPLSPGSCCKKLTPENRC